MNNINKWLIGISTAFIANFPFLKTDINKICPKNCSICGTNCILLPFLLFWICFCVFLGKIQKVKKFLKVNINAK